MIELRIQSSGCMYFLLLRLKLFRFSIINYTNYKKYRQSPEERVKERHEGFEIKEGQRNGAQDYSSAYSFIAVSFFACQSVCQAEHIRNSGGIYFPPDA